MSTVAVAVSELIGPALDWAVAQICIADGAMTGDEEDGISGLPYFSVKFGKTYLWGAGHVQKGTHNKETGKPWITHGCGGAFSPSTDGTYGAELLHKHAVWLKPSDPYADFGGTWTATCITNRTDAAHTYFHQEGETLLIAGMRAIVGAILGDTVEIPTELLEQSA